MINASATRMQVHKTLSNSKCNKAGNKNTQATADEAALTDFAQQISELMMYNHISPRFHIIQFEEIEHPVLPDASLEQQSSQPQVMVIVHISCI